MKADAKNFEIEDEATGAVTFRRVMVLMAIAAAIVAGVVTIINSPNTFAVDDKHWTCTASEPVGIGAECTNLSKKKLGLRTE